MLAKNDTDLPISHVTGKPLTMPLSNRSLEDIRAELARERQEHHGLSWHIVRCLGKSDVYVINWLEKLKIETYYPKVRELRPVPKKALSHRQRESGVTIIKPQIVPFFPRYIFVHFDMGKDGWRKIFDFVGVGGMAGYGELPIWVPESFLDRIRLREVGGAVPGKTPVKLIFEVGDEVMVSDGPFASFPGIVESILEKSIQDVDSETRIKVAVNLFGRQVPVDLEISQIEKT